MHASQGQGNRGRQPVTETEAAPTDLPRRPTLRERAAALFTAQHVDLTNQFSACELERLRFIRWLYQTGRVAA